MIGVWWDKLLLGALNREKVLTVIGRGHSGTRVIASALSASGVFMGTPLNLSHDLVPPDRLYQAMRLAGRRVRYKGNYEWDFSGLIQKKPDDAFYRHLRIYLSRLISRPHHNGYCGWKIPETLLCFPWMVRLFPRMKYIYWVRDPRDVILGAHVTDDFGWMAVPFETPEDVMIRRAASWKYQWDLVKATPKPEYFMRVRYEDFVENPEETLGRLEDFLGMPLARTEVLKTRIGLWRRVRPAQNIPFLTEALVELGYESGAPGK